MAAIVYDNLAQKYFSVYMNIQLFLIKGDILDFDVELDFEVFSTTTMVLVHHCTRLYFRNDSDLIKAQLFFARIVSLQALDFSVLTLHLSYLFSRLTNSVFNPIPLYSIWYIIPS